MRLTSKSIPEKMTFSAIFNDFKQLTKVGLSLSVVFSSLAGYLLAVEKIDISILILLAIGGYLMVGASNAFNQIIEKDTDALMKRTMNRPLPAGRMHVSMAMVIAVSFTIIGLAILYSINPKSALFGAISIFLYTSIYTPLKAVTPLSVFVGAIPGAIPFMLGWVAATNAFSIEPGMLFLIQFFWQFPHFWAIAWLLHEDYQRAGFKMLPTGARDQATAFQIVFYSLWTLIISILPVFKFTGLLTLSLPGAMAIFALGLFLIYGAIQLMQQKTEAAALKLMRISIIQISLLQLIYVLDKIFIQ